MLTAIVHARAQPMALAETLASLVPAVAEGLMSHAVVINDAPDGSIDRIADAMGATLIIAASEPWRTAALAARGDWVILFDAGDTPDSGWIGAIEGHLLRQSSDAMIPAWLPLATGTGGFAERIRLAFGLCGVGAGLVAPRRVIAQGGRVGRPRRLRTGRRRTLD